MTKFGIALLSSLGIVGQLAIVALVAGIVAWFASAGARRALGGVRDALGRHGVWLAWFVATVATVGSLWFSNGAGFFPCHLCWLQRYVMYPLVAVLVVVAIARRWWLTLLAMLAALVGAGISAYHIWVENHPDAAASCGIGKESCGVKWINEFGYITIPTLAGTAFLLIVLLLGIAAFWQRSHARRAGAP